MNSKLFTFTRRTRLTAVLGFVVSLPLALVYWPSACSPQSSQLTADHSERAGQPEQPASLVTTSPWRGVLPHPAFALADASANGAVSIADIAERVTPSVVNISSERVVKSSQMQFPFPFFFGPPEGGGERKQQGSGSGVIVAAEGIVLTNNHVVEEATEIKVTTSDSREFEAEVVGTDAKSDLAVLKLKGNVEGLRPLGFGDSSQMRLGDVVLAIGNPFGVGQTVTMGIVSAVGRADVGIVDYEDFIQTDAAINPGNSGGALVNMRGELIGVNTAILSRTGGYQGIGFAIPSKMAQPIMRSLIETGRVSRGFLGVGIQDLTPELAQAMGIPSTQGVVITDVRPGSAADKAGLKQGDIVQGVDGTAVASSGRLRNLIAGKGGNSKARLDVLRGGKRLPIEVTLGELQDDAPAKEPGSGQHQGTLGMQLSPLTDALRQRLEMDSKEPGSVVVSGIERGSAADEAGLQPGDVVLEINRTAVKDVAQAKALLKSGDKVLLLIRRAGATRFVVLSR